MVGDMLSCCVVLVVVLLWVGESRLLRPGAAERSEAIKLLLITRVLSDSRSDTYHQRRAVYIRQ